MFEWTGNVGLVNVSDLLRASTNIACTSASDELYAVVGPTMKETCGSYLTEMSVGSEGIESMRFLRKILMYSLQLG